MVERPVWMTSHGMTHFAWHPVTFNDFLYETLRGPETWSSSVDLAQLSKLLPEE
jgi:hypothetical protein